MALAQVIVECFGLSPELGAQSLSSFSVADWHRTEYWLDTSGLALYFLDHMRKQDLARLCGSSMYWRLKEKLRRNSLRVSAMKAEFIAINRCFLAAKIHYANVKGFTLYPHACSDLSLRLQSDYDFLVDPDDIDTARGQVEDLGYTLKASTPRTLEFKPAMPMRIHLGDQYTAELKRSIELHIAIEGIAMPTSPPCKDERLRRTEIWSEMGVHLPVLSGVDQLILQARHTLQHLRDSHIRPSWIMEFRYHVMFRMDEPYFLSKLKRLAQGDAETVVALGLSILLGEDLFGSFAPVALKMWTVDTLSPKVRLWAKMYGRRAVLADVPGTKLCLLLDKALEETHPAVMRRSRLRRLIPHRLPQRIALRPQQETLRHRLRREWNQVKFIAYRSRFHITQGLIYMLERRRWDRALLLFQTEVRTGNPKQSPAFTKSDLTQDNRTKTFV